MSKLWVYGDSYAVNHENCDWQWTKNLARLLKVDHLSQADYGVANEWICMKFVEDYKVAKNIKRGDTVVIVMTACVRHWFLWEHPNISNYENMINWPAGKFGITQDQIDAVEQYYKHIQKGYVDAWKYDATTAWWNWYAQDLNKKGIELIIIPGFNNTTDVLHDGTVPVRGSLFHAVCETEFTSPKAMEKYYARGIPDQRINHMLRDNHHVLAEAIFKSINDRSILDLDKLSWTTGKLNLSTEKMLRNQLSPVPLR
jgi:hypothetical protein|tara:strand:+ start:7419 stop:8186 length:768 start_codon:yes stop_codon:yes gene_type:complete